jgi:hypothetical protein
VYYGTDKKRIYRVDNANTGTPTPVDITALTLPSTGNVSCIATDPNDGNKVIVAYSNYGVYSIWNSNDAGATWTKAAGNLEAAPNGTGNGPSVRWISVLPVSDGTIYLASTSTGLYATDTLNGLNTVWVRQGQNSIGAVVCDMTDVRVSDGYVVVGTHAGGVYSTHLTSVNDIVTVRNPAAIAAMDVNVFPNPASEMLNVKFSVQQEAETEIMLLDELGRTVQLMSRGKKSAGVHTEQLNVGGLAAGMYYVRLRVGEGVETKLVVIQN